MLEQSVVDHEQVPMPFEQARTMLALGTVLRRARRNRDARAALTDALDTFTGCARRSSPGGGRSWRGSAAGRATSLELTATEAQVADLVAAGEHQPGGRRTRW